MAAFSIPSPLVCNVKGHRMEWWQWVSICISTYEYASLYLRILVFQSASVHMNMCLCIFVSWYFNLHQYFIQFPCGTQFPFFKWLQIKSNMNLNLSWKAIYYFLLISVLPHVVPHVSMHSCNISELESSYIKLQPNFLLASNLNSVTFQAKRKQKIFWYNHGTCQHTMYIHVRHYFLGCNNVEGRFIYVISTEVIRHLPRRSG